MPSRYEYCEYRPGYAAEDLTNIRVRAQSIARPRSLLYVASRRSRSDLQRLLIVRDTHLRQALHPFVFLVFLVAPLLPVSSSCMANEFGDPKEVVILALDAWKRQDWNALYSALSRLDKNAMTVEEFGRQQDLLAGSVTRLADYEVNDVKVTENEADSNGRGVAQITLHLREGPDSRFWGSNEWRPVTQSAEWNLVLEPNGWKIELGLRPMESSEPSGDPPFKFHSGD